MDIISLFPPPLRLINCALCPSLINSFLAGGPCAKKVPLHYSSFDVWLPHTLLLYAIQVAINYNLQTG